MSDYLAVGAGSAGCVLAARLTEDPGASVVLVEAGPADTAAVIHVRRRSGRCSRPAGTGTSTTSWSRGWVGVGPTCRRGRMLGGSSSMNAMVYIRGNAADYDRWAAGGARGWGYRDVLPYFIRSEDNERGADDYHGVGGPQHVSDSRALSPMVDAFVEAALDVMVVPNTAAAL